MTARSWYHRTAGLFAVLAVAFVLSCGKDDPVGPPPPVPPPTVERVVLDAGGFPSVIPDSTSFALARFDSAGVERLLCTDYIGAQVMAVPDLTVLAADIDLQYPGAVLQFAKLDALMPTPVTADRAAGTLVLTTADGREISGEVTALTGDLVDLWRRENLAALGEQAPGDWELSVAAVYNDEHLAMHAGVSLFGMPADAEYRLAVGDDARGRALVRLRRVDHTVSCAWPGRAGLAFADDVNGNDITDQMAEGNPPVWLAAVDHGEVMLVLVEAAAQPLDVVDAAKRTFVAAATGNAPTAGDLVFDLPDVQVRAFAVGADADALEAAGNAGMSALTDFLQAAPGPAADLPAMSAAVEALADGAPVMVNLDSDYGVTLCDPYDPVFEDVLWSYFAEDAYTERVYGDLQSDGLGTYYYSGGSGQFLHDEVRFVPDLLGSGGRAEPDGRRPLLLRPDAIGGRPAVELFDLFLSEGILHSGLSFDGTSLVQRAYTIFMVIGRPEDIRLTYDTPFGTNSRNRDNKVGHFLHGVGDQARRNLIIGYDSLYQMSYEHKAYRIEVLHNQPDGWRVYTFRFGAASGLTAWVNGELLDQDPTDNYSLLAFNGASLCARWLAESVSEDFSALWLAEIVAYAGDGTDLQVQDEVARLREKYGI